MEYSHRCRGLPGPRGMRGLTGPRGECGEGIVGDQGLPGPDRFFDASYLYMTMNQALVPIVVAETNTPLQLSNLSVILQEKVTVNLDSNTLKFQDQQHDVSEVYFVLVNGLHVDIVNPVTKAYLGSNSALVDTKSNSVIQFIVKIEEPMLITAEMARRISLILFRV